MRLYGNVLNVGVLVEMNRELKFRVWIENLYHPETGENLGNFLVPIKGMEYSLESRGRIDTIFLDMHHQRIDQPIYKLGMDIIKEYQNQKFTIMQYIGLKDKNGKEIYEGDIIEEDIIDHDRLYIVKFGNYHEQFMCSEPGYGWYLENIHTKEVCSIITFMSGNNDYDEKVIGNIYENPDLLGDTPELLEK